jgi:hypothetical protein
MPGGKPQTVDRILVSEDYAATRQQRVRGFTLTATLTNGSAVDLLGPAGVSAGTSIGAKFIAVLDSPVAGVVSITLNVTSSRGSPFIREVAAYSCSGLAARLDAEWTDGPHGHAAASASQAGGAIGWTPTQRYQRMWAPREYSK